jgi:Fe2+ or Zn2+ uptake regulation protein
MEHEVRKLPKKTIVIIAILVILGIISFLLASAGKATKAEKILAKLGYKNISEVTVYATQEFLREDINVKGIKYTVSFTDNNTKQHCKGFILQDYKGNVEKDLLCKKEL